MKNLSKAIDALVEQLNTANLIKPMWRVQVADLIRAAFSALLNDYAAPEGWAWQAVLVPKSRLGDEFIDGRGLQIMDTVKAQAMLDDKDEQIKELQSKLIAVRMAL